MKALLDGLEVVYSGKDIWSRNEKLPPERRLRLRESHGFSDDQMENVHPAVRVHPKTGRKAVFATSAYFKRFVGWSEDESRALLNYLQSLAQHLHYHCRVKWKKDTLLVWDNRFTLHRGVHDFRYERSHLIRTTVAASARYQPRIAADEGQRHDREFSKEQRNDRKNGPPTACGCADGNCSWRATGYSRKCGGDGETRTNAVRGAEYRVRQRIL